VSPAGTVGDDAREPVLDTEGIRVKMTAMPTTRDALLDAAWDAVVAGDWQRTRMADVAAVAGVSRQTLYNEFGTKDALARALTLRETARFLDGVRDAVEEAGPAAPHESVRSAVEYTVGAAGDNPLLKAVLTDDAGLLPLLTTRGEPIIALARDHMFGVLTERWPELPDADLALVAETVTRLTISYLVAPADHDASAEAVAVRVSRIVRRLLADAAPTAPEVTA
jgi:AcrR family transcriptional regulator